MAEEDISTQGSAGTVYFMLTDNLGTLRDAVDTSGTVQDHLVYTEFGHIFSESNTAIGHWQDFAFQHLDSNTGLALDGHRWYDPATGKWINEDPEGFSARDPNLKRYAGNATTTTTDATGLQSYLPGPLSGGPNTCGPNVLPPGALLFSTGTGVIQMWVPGPGFFGGGVQWYSWSVMLGWQSVSGGGTFVAPPGLLPPSPVPPQFQPPPATPIGPPPGGAIGGPYAPPLASGGIPAPTLPPDVPTGPTPGSISSLLGGLQGVGLGLGHSLTNPAEDFGEIETGIMVGQGLLFKWTVKITQGIPNPGHPIGPPKIGVELGNGGQEGPKGPM